MSEIRALLFDMDGVIVDSNPLHRAAWVEYNRRFGIETTDRMIRMMYGTRNDELIRGFLGADLSDDEVFAHGAAKERLYREMMQPGLAGALVPGVLRFIERHRDLRMAVASNAERANLDLVLDGAGLREFFAVAVNGSEVVHPKPHPEIYLKAADLLGVEYARCVVFEDSYPGVQAGVAAGMKVVGLTTTHDDLPGVSLLIRDFNDPALEAWLSQGVGGM